MKKFVLILIVLSGASLPTFAQENKYTGGMKYTTMRPAQPQDIEKKPIYNRATPENEETVAEEVAIEKTPEKSVWDKYRELASGKKPDTKEDSALPKAPEKPTVPSQQGQQEKAQSPSGIGNIIAEYQKNKQKRSQMQSITFAKPEAPEVKTPEVKAPSVEKPATAKNN